jgi:hypothetical protein
MLGIDHDVAILDAQIPQRPRAKTSTASFMVFSASRYRAADGRDLIRLSSRARDLG